MLYSTSIMKHCKIWKELLNIVLISIHFWQKNCKQNIHFACFKNRIILRSSFSTKSYTYVSKHRILQKLPVHLVKLDIKWFIQRLWKRKSYHIHKLRFCEKKIMSRIEDLKRHFRCTNSVVKEVKKIKYDLWLEIGKFLCRIF